MYKELVTNSLTGASFLLSQNEAFREWKEDNREFSKVKNLARKARDVDMATQNAREDGIIRTSQADRETRETDKALKESLENIPSNSVRNIKFKDKINKELRERGARRGRNLLRTRSARQRPISNESSQDGQMNSFDQLTTMAKDTAVDNIANKVQQNTEFKENQKQFRTALKEGWQDALRKEIEDDFNQQIGG